MKTLITGGAGFIGSHLSEALLEKGHKVSVVDDLSTGKLENIQHLQNNPDFSFVEGDILDEELMGNLTTEADEIYHLAAVVGVKALAERGLKAKKVNIDGTEMVFRLASKAKKKVVFTSSPEAYGLWLRHTGTKAAAEALAFAFWREKNLPVVVVRLFDTCGERQSENMVVPRLISAALLDNPLEVYEDGTQSRCFAYVGDVVRAIIGLMETEEAIGEVFNIGNDEEINIQELAEKIIELTESDSEIKYIPCEEVYEEETKELKRSVPDISKISGLTGWKPETSLDDGLKKTIKWFSRI